jgi:hypothetical protein
VRLDVHALANESSGIKREEAPTESLVGDEHSYVAEGARKEVT